MIRRLRRLRLIPALGVLAVAASVSPLSLAAQETGFKPLRVETHEVYVPILVFDEARLRQLQKMDLVEFGQKLVANNLDFGSVVIGDLRSENFRLFEDGQEMKIQKVAPKFQLSRPINDSEGVSEDFVGAGGGIWIAPGRPIDLDGNTALNVPEWLGYLITYASPRASDGNCHHVAVKVDRPHSLVFGRTEYCNAADPLKGTDLDRQLQSEMSSAKKGKIGLAVSAVDFFTDTQVSRVHIAVEFSPNVIWRTGEDCSSLPEIRILGLVYSESGSIVTRFSDFMSRNFSPRGEALPLLLPTTSGPISCSSTGPSYETQVTLSPGRYNLRVALKDGKDLAHAELPFTVENRGENALVLSGIALGRRYRDATAAKDQMPTDLPVNYSPLISRGFELTPRAGVAFDRSEPLYYYMEVFAPPSTQPPPLIYQVQLRIVDAQSGVVKSDLPPFDVAPYARAGNPIIPIADKIDISHLPIGQYRLEVQAADSAGRTTPWRSASFTAQ